MFHDLKTWTQCCREYCLASITRAMFRCAFRCVAQIVPPPFRNRTTIALQYQSPSTTWPVCAFVCVCVCVCVCACVRMGICVLIFSAYVRHAFACGKSSHLMRTVPDQQPPTSNIYLSPLVSASIRTALSSHSAFFNRLPLLFPSSFIRCPRLKVIHTLFVYSHTNSNRYTCHTFIPHIHYLTICYCTCACVLCSLCNYICTLHTNAHTHKTPTPTIDQQPAFSNVMLCHLCCGPVGFAVAVIAVVVVVAAVFCRGRCACDITYFVYIHNCPGQQ